MELSITVESWRKLYVDTNDYIKLTMQQTINLSIYTYLEMNNKIVVLVSAEYFIWGHKIIMFIWSHL